ncbi:hypothetical protein MAA_08677 [Metarhizium robertsii ARSEF 23]|uniref:Uncharacterized protein n=1 Tax=Metarhizium robertsii (strain ARSEF 23 / ATCC MYA-3075) TaxID=655844 RepID=E9F8S8_METRA|nr:uncharacterized protein MAA_08677 [Metarhizium robertsii ARSEF 23]EFY95869.2 hypothetical protein MAA_08677 [Metarhizium robertsii ARSEF 23]
MTDLFFSRACSPSSAGNLAIKSDGGIDSDLVGGLRSGRGASGSRLSDNEKLLLHNFLLHCKLPERKADKLYLEHATALVSVSNRVVDTLQRAFNKYYVDKEPPESIYIVFIRIPAGKFLFEWAIPDDFVVHSVSIKTLLDRGLTLKNFLIGQRLPPTAELCHGMAYDTFPTNSDAWEIGLALGFLVRPFGARAPSCWIASQLFWDLIQGLSWETLKDLGIPQSVTIVSRGGELGHVALSFFEQVTDGIETCLDWWLLDDRFVLAFEEYKLWRDLKEERILDACNYLYLILPSRGFELAEASFEREQTRFMAEVEAAAIKIGL